MLYNFTYIKYTEWANPWYRKQADDWQGWEWLLNGHWVSVWDDEKVLDLESGDGCMVLWMYSVPLNYTLWMANFMLYIFYHNKKLTQTETMNHLGKKSSGSRPRQCSQIWHQNMIRKRKTDKLSFPSILNIYLQKALLKRWKDKL